MEQQKPDAVDEPARVDRVEDDDQDLTRFYDEAHGGELTEHDLEVIFPLQHSLNRPGWRYRCEEELALGGMKRLYRAVDLKTDRVVAYAEPLDRSSPDEVERFLYEARLTAHLEHPYIVPVHDMGFDPEGTPYFTMKMLAGRPLADILKNLGAGDAAVQRKYGRNELLSLVLKVCAAVDYAHSMRVLHLDIKPDNILMGRYGDVQLVDWGLSRFLGDDIPDWGCEDGGLETGATWSGRLKGSPGYMAPEQAVEGGDVTEQTDVYGLGALLYAVLAGRAPVQGRNAAEVLENTRTGNIQDINEAVPDISRGLAAVVKKALSLKPEDRYQSVTALREDLSRYLRGFPTAAEKADFITLVRLFYRRNPVRCNIFLGAVAVVNILVVIFIGRIHREQVLALDARDQAVAAQQAAEHNLELFREEQTRRQDLEFGTRELVRLVQPLTDYSSAPYLIQILDRAIKITESEQERHVFLGKKATLLFVQQRFNEACRILDMEGVEPAGYTGPSQKIIRDTAHRFAAVKPDDSKPLTEEQMQQFLDSLYPSYGADIRELYFFTYVRHRQLTRERSPEECLPTALKLLDCINITYNFDAMSQRKLEKRDGGYALDLSDTPYCQLSVVLSGRVYLNALAPLQLKSLDLSGIENLDFYGIHQGGLSLDELNLAGTHPPYDIWQLKFKNLGLKRIVLDENYPEEMRETLRENGVEVVIAGTVQ